MEPADNYPTSRFRLVRRGGYWHIHGRDDGKKIRFSTREREIGRAKALFDSFMFRRESGLRLKANTDGWATIARKLHSRQKFSAKHRGIPWSIRPGHVYALMRQSRFHCSISGIPFSARPTKEGERDPWSPSIDRIDSREGYTPDNVRVVCVAANLALNSFGYDVLLRLARGIIRNSAAVLPEANQAILDTKAEIFDGKQLMQQ